MPIKSFTWILMTRKRERALINQNSSTREAQHTAVILELKVVFQFNTHLTHLPSVAVDTFIFSRVEMVRQRRGQPNDPSAIFSFEGILRGKVSLTRPGSQ
jgi:hypothetical protein